MNIKFSCKSFRDNQVKVPGREDRIELVLKEVKESILCSAHIIG